MSRASFAAGVLGSIVLFGCNAEPPAAVGSRTEWIVDGVRDDTPSVVWLYNRTSGGLCSGTIIAPRVVLTAKHCVQEQGASGPSPAAGFIVGVGSRAGTGESLSVIDVDTTPGVYTSGLRGLTGQDVGLLTLRTGVATVMPVPLHRDPPTDLVGDEVTIIGFGQTPSGGAGTKYRTTDTIRFMDGGVIYTGPSTCQGDSGGPVILSATNELVGVTSFGTTGGCGTGGLAGANRIDVHLDLIDEVVGASGACLNDGAERCDGFDNDCNDMIDETCSALGTPCMRHDECVGLLCETTPAGDVCTAECDPLRPELSCPSGLYCARVEGCRGFCVPLPPSRPEPLGVGEDCTSDLECISLFCADPGDGRRRCLQPCRGDEGNCLAGEACAAPAGACGGCVPADIVGELNGLGEPCAADADCISSSCLDDLGGLYCTRACNPAASELTCPMGYHCRPAGDGTGLCARGPAEGVGGACVSNGDCHEPGTFCATRGEGHWCSRFCMDATECPEEFECVPAGDRAVCAPALALVGEDCMADADCISGLCALDATGLAGTCTRECGVDAACSGGFECRRSEDGTMAFCVRPEPPPPPPADDGGCSAVSGPRPGRLASVLASALLGGVVIGFFGRRRRRRA